MQLNYIQTMISHWEAETTVQQGLHFYQ